MEVMTELKRLLRERGVQVDNFHDDLHLWQAYLGATWLLYYLTEGCKNADEAIRIFSEVIVELKRLFPQMDFDMYFPPHGDTQGARWPEVEGTLRKWKWQPTPVAENG